MAERKIVVSQVHINDAGLEATFLVLPTGVREIAGRPVAVVQSIQLAVEHPSYADQIKALIVGIETLVADAMDDYEDAEPWQAEVARDDLDDVETDEPDGMGYR